MKVHVECLLGSLVNNDLHVFYFRFPLQRRLFRTCPSLYLPRTTYICYTILVMDLDLRQGHVVRYSRVGYTTSLDGWEGNK